jgi:hypothetical protein
MRSLDGREVVVQTSEVSAEIALDLYRRRRCLKGATLIQYVAAIRAALWVPREIRHPTP